MHDSHKYLADLGAKALFRMCCLKNLKVSSVSRLREMGRWTVSRRAGSFVSYLDPGLSETQVFCLWMLFYL